MPNWFAYDNVGDPTLPGSYYLSSFLPNCITGGCRICAIYLNDDNETPTSIPGSVLRYIANAHITMVSQPVDGGSARRFVYVRNC